MAGCKFQEIRGFSSCHGDQAYPDKEKNRNLILVEPLDPDMSASD